jgi:hypothetical protein
MAQIVQADRLPEDEAGQSFLGLYDPELAEFAITLVVGRTKQSTYQVGFMGVGVAYKVVTTHDAATVTSDGKRQGADEEGKESSTEGVDARGFNHCSFLVTVTGLAEGETLGLYLYRRFTSAGVDLTPERTVTEALTNGNNFVPEVPLDAPFFIIEAKVLGEGTAVVTVKPYLFWR